MERDAATLPNGFLFEDRYEILEELGSGSFGRVYQARQLSTGQSVAIKLLSAREGTESSTGREADRFRRETEICALCVSPWRDVAVGNIVPAPETPPEVPARRVGRRLLARRCITGLWDSVRPGQRAVDGGLPQTPCHVWLRLHAKRALASEAEPHGYRRRDFDRLNLASRPRTSPR